jgi:hypothetical protein
MPRTFDATGGILSGEVYTQKYPPVFSRNVAVGFVWFAAAWAAMNLGFAVWGLTIFAPDRAFTLCVASFLPWAPFFLATLMIRSASRTETVLSVDSAGASMRGFLTDVSISWQDVAHVCLARVIAGRTAEPLPAVAVLRAHQNPADRFDRCLTVVANGVQPEDVDGLLTQILRYAPRATVDPEVVLLAALARQAVQHSATVGEPGRIRTLSPFDPIVLHMRQAASPAAPQIVAPMEYLLGNCAKAKSESESGEPAAIACWDMLLCRALCARQLGDRDGYQRLLRAAADSAPGEFAAPLLSAAGVVG